MRVGAQRDTKCTRKPKVSQLQVALLVDQQVLRLQVSVQDAVRMAEVDATDQLVCEFLRRWSAPGIRCARW